MTPELEKVSEALENVQMGLLICWLNKYEQEEGALSWVLLGLSLELLDLIDVLEPPR